MIHNANILDLLFTAFILQSETKDTLQHTHIMKSIKFEVMILLNAERQNC